MAEDVDFAGVIDKALAYYGVCRAGDLKKKMRGR